ATLDAQLRQPHDVREELVRRSARCGRINPLAMGFVKQGQGHGGSIVISKKSSPLSCRSARACIPHSAREPAHQVADGLAILTIGRTEITVHMYGLSSVVSDGRQDEVFSAFEKKR
ncbi:hypothetical protein, partial [Burkholderia pseudomallei]|uniref:hypothetical protein n=1 Tax=Burkholderia pseudomallei TaxID=28450 RepID=UPI001C727197